MRARDNPYRVERVDRVGFRLPGGNWEELLIRLAALDYRAAVVGRKGRGKTRLLEELAGRLFARGWRPVWLRLSRRHRWLDREQRRTLQSLDCGSLLLVDGAEELGRWAWRALEWRSRAAAGLVVTAHTAGLLPTLVECTTTVGLLQEIVHELGEDAGRSLPALFDRHRGNLRSALRELYDLAARA